MSWFQYLVVFSRFCHTTLVVCLCDELAGRQNSHITHELATYKLIPDFVFSCCTWFPKKKAVEGLIELGKQIHSEEKIIESIFKFKHHDGDSCLTALFEMPNLYRFRNNGKFPSGPMLVDIEESCAYLIQLAKSAKLDLNKILNHTDKVGQTLFSRASNYSEKMTKQLLMENVRVNSVDVLFVTPFFRVRLKIDF